MEPADQKRNSNVESQLIGSILEQDADSSLNDLAVDSLADMQSVFARRDRFDPSHVSHLGAPGQSFFARSTSAPPTVSRPLEEVLTR